jgi:uncharacterized protein YqhQ
MPETTNADTRSAQATGGAHSKESRPYIGGQAVLEGVMMRSPRSFAVVVRRRGGELVVRERPMTDYRRGALAWPFVRGVASLLESLQLGSEALRFSSELYEQDLDAEEQANGSSDTSKTKGKKSHPLAGALRALSAGVLAVATHENDRPASTEGDGTSAPALAARQETTTEPIQERGKKGASVLAVAFAIVLFVALPQGMTALSSRLLGLHLDVRSPVFQLLTGSFKLAIVVGYLLLIRRVPEIRRVFQYHGAEHKTISTYEAGEPLVVSYARGKTTLHPRCGTTFLVMVALVSVVLFSAIGFLLPQLHLGPVLDNVFFFVIKLPFLVPLAAVTFELQRLFARYCSTGPLRVLLWPGFLVQKITTIEPDDDQLEVALGSLRATLWREQSREATAPEATERRFADFGALTTDAAYGGAGTAV